MAAVGYLTNFTLYKILFSQHVTDPKPSWIEDRRKEVKQELEALYATDYPYLPEIREKIKKLKAILDELKDAKRDQKLIDEKFVTSFNMNNLQRGKEFYYKGADVNAALGGATALMAAAAHGNAEAVFFLVGKGANPYLNNDEGKNTFDVARPEVRGILQAYNEVKKGGLREYEQQFTALLSWLGMEFQEDEGYATQALQICTILGVHSLDELAKKGAQDVEAISHKLVSEKLKLSFIWKLKRLGDIEDMLINVQFKEKLGSGNFGTVHRGEYNGKSVALKQTKYDEEALKQLWREIAILRDLKQYNNKHILQFLGYVKLKDGFFIVTEFVELKDLADFLKKCGKMYDPRHKARMGLQIVDGMECLERHDIIHRDLAARNVLVGLENGNLSLKISDFGLSRPSNYQAKPNSDFSRPWAAPEVIQHKKFSHKADVWSFGVTFWEIFTNGEVTPCVWKHGQTQKYYDDMVYELKSYPNEALPIFGMIWQEEPDPRVSFNFLRTILALGYADHFCQPYNLEPLDFIPYLGLPPTGLDDAEEADIPKDSPYGKGSQNTDE